eukprot:COSAG01_NODE_2205_length_8172_cov_35.082126_2_plen_84_part_00
MLIYCNNYFFTLVDRLTATLLSISLLKFRGSCILKVYPDPAVSAPDHSKLSSIVYTTVHFFAWRVPRYRGTFVYGEQCSQTGE